MKKIFLLLAFVLFSFFSETFGQVKGTAPGLFNTIADLQATTPVLSYGSELAYVLEDKSMWRYDRTDEEWQRQVYIDFGVGLPSGDPGTAPKLYMNITTGDLYQWDSSGDEWVVVTGGTDDQIASEVPFNPTGDILSSDLQSVCVEIQTQLSAVQAALGIANGAQGFGSFTGSTLSDNETAKVLLQELENAVETDNYLLDPEGAEQFIIRRYGDNVDSNEFVTSKARGTKSAPTTVQDNDILGGIEFHAYDGSVYDQAGRIIPLAANVSEDNNIDSRLVFETGKDALNNGYTPLELNKDGSILDYTIEFNEYGQGNKTADSLSKTESGYLAQYATDGTLLESSTLTLEDTALVMGANRLYTGGSYVLNYGLNNSAYNSNDYASLFVGTRNFKKAVRSVFHFAVGDDIFPNYESSGRQMFGFGSEILNSLKVGNDIFAFGDKVAINATSASNAFIFGNFGTRNCRDLSLSFVFNAGAWENLKEASGSVFLSTLINSPAENSSADSTANNSFLALENALKNATHKDDAIAIGRNAGEGSTGLQPIVLGKDCQGTTVDYHSIVAPNYYTRLSAGLFDFDIDQDTAGMQGEALRLSDDGEIRFIKVEESSSSIDTTDGNGDITISHSLGTDQISVTAKATGTTFYHVQVHSKTSTEFKVRVFEVSVGSAQAVPSTAVTVDWHASKI